MSSSFPASRRPGRVGVHSAKQPDRAGIQSAKRSGRTGVQSAKLSDVSLFASSTQNEVASRFKSAGLRQAWQTDSLSPTPSLGTNSKAGRRSKFLTDSLDNRPNSAPLGLVQNVPQARSLTSSWERQDFTKHDERLVTFDADEFDASASVTAPNRPKPRPRTATAWLRKIENYSPFPRGGGKTPLATPLGFTQPAQRSGPIALRDENLELETPRSPAFFVDLGLSGKGPPLPVAPGQTLLPLSFVSPPGSPDRAASPGLEQMEWHAAPEEDVYKMSGLTSAAEEEMQRRLKVLDDRENQISAARIRPSDARAMREKAAHDGKTNQAAPVKITDFSVKPAPKKVVGPSERLMQTKYEQKEAIRVKSYRVRMDELNSKLVQFRYNPSELEDKIRKRKQLMRASQHFDCVASNRLAIHDVHNAQNQAELRVLRAMEEELKILVNRTNCKSRRREEHFQKLLDIEDRKQRKVHRKLCAENEAEETRMATLAMLLLPAFAAAARVSVLAEILTQSRVDRVHLNKIDWAATFIQKNLRWLAWNRQFARRIVIKAFMRRNLWFAVFNFRCRRKARATNKIAVFLKECYGREPITMAFARYKYKIIVLQRLCRTSIQARKCRLDVLHRQWTAVVMYYRDYQNFGMVTQKRVSFTEAMKKNLENIIVTTKSYRSKTPPSSGLRRPSSGNSASSAHPDHFPHPPRPHSPPDHSAPKPRARRQSLYLQHGADLTRRTGIVDLPQKDEVARTDRRRSSYYQPSYMQGRARRNQAMGSPLGSSPLGSPMDNALGIHPSLLVGTIAESSSEAIGDGDFGRQPSAAWDEGAIPIHSEHFQLQQPPSWENAHESLLPGGIKAVRGVNFFHVPVEPNEHVKRMLQDLSRTRMQRFSEDLREWRMMYADWAANKSAYESEARASAVVHGKADDHIPTFLAPETLQMKREVDRATKDYKGRKKFYLQDGKALFTWTRWRSKPKGDRKRDVEYRRKGPPRPVYRNMLDEEEELWPLLEKARQLANLERTSYRQLPASARNSARQL